MPVAAQQRLSSVVMPTAGDEIWRYSRIAELDLARFHPVSVSPDIVGDSGAATSGVWVDPEMTDCFDELNVELGSPVRLVIPAGRHIAQPIVIEHEVTEELGASFPGLIIDAGADSEVTIVERFVSSDSVTAIVVPKLELLAGQAARVKYIAINELGRSTWLIANQRITGERDSTVNLSNVSLGGDYARVRTHARCVGKGASTKQTALYFADGTQMHDFRITQEHIAPFTNADLLFKGAVAGRAASVYTGLIKIGKDARGTAAFQTNRNLTLSAGAWAESVPNLDIETNDVRCSHASTVGPVDADQLFYLESRGVPPEIAERLIVLGFFDEVLSQLPLGELAARLRATVADKLDARPM